MTQARTRRPTRAEREELRALRRVVRAAGESLRVCVGAEQAELTIAVCMQTLGDRSPAAREALTAGVDLGAADAGRQVELRCGAIVDIVGAPAAYVRQLLARPDALPHQRYAARRAAELRRIPVAPPPAPIPLVVDGAVVAHAADRAEADRWLARFEAELRRA